MVFLASPTSFICNLPPRELSVTPVKLGLTPEERAKDIKQHKANDHKFLEQRKEDTCYRPEAISLLERAKQMNIPSLPDQVPCQQIVKFISEMKKRIFHFQKDQEDQEVKFAKKLLFQARRLKIKDLPSEVPQENLQQFNENLCHLIKKANERRSKEAYEFMNASQSVNESNN